MAGAQNQWHCCKTNFYCYLSLIEHVDKSHLQYALFICQIDKVNKYHEREFKHKCNKCGMQFNLFEEAALHFVSTHVKTYVKCRKCPAKASNLRQFHQHRCSQQTTQKLMQFEGEQQDCPICNNHHTINNCAIFIGNKAKERTQLVKQVGICFKCLKKHNRTQCQRENCTYCGWPHHELLCYKIENGKQLTNNSISS